MKITFIANGCAIYEADNFRIASDPWLIDGAFEGSWCHFPPITTTPTDLAKIVDALYISHAHPDHYDERTLQAFDRNIPIIVLDQPPNILKRLLTKQGFTNIVLAKSGEPHKLGPFEVKLLRSFDAHHFQQSEIENVLDSSCYLSAGGVQVLNFNDNIPSLETCRNLNTEFPKLDLVQVQYTGAGPYPSCFRNLSYAEKETGNYRVQEQHGSHVGHIAKVMQPRHIMPFAGQFSIGGKEWPKNQVLGTATADFAAQRSREIAPEIPVVLLTEGMSVELPSGAIDGGPYKPLDLAARDTYIRSTLAQISYPYESEPEPDSQVDMPRLRDLFINAHTHLLKKQDQFNYRPDCVLSFAFWDQAFEIDLLKGTTRFCAKDADVLHDETGRDFVQIYTDERLLFMLLSGRAHWNNAMVGMHLEFHRQPERYDPDLYMLLSYFHAPLKR